MIECRCCCRERGLRRRSQTRISQTSHVPAPPSDRDISARQGTSFCGMQRQEQTDFSINTRIALMNLFFQHLHILLAIYCHLPSFAQSSWPSRPRRVSADGQHAQPRFQKTSASETSSHMRMRLFLRTGARNTANEHMPPTLADCIPSFSRANGALC